MEVVANTQPSSQIALPNQKPSEVNSKSDFQKMFEEELQEKIKELNNQENTSEDIKINENLKNPQNTKNKNQTSTKSTSEIKDLAKSSDLNLTKLKVSHGAKKSKINKDHTKSSTTNSLDLVKKSKETKANQALADALHEIARNDAKNHQSKNLISKVSEREEMIRAKKASLPRDQKFDQAIKELQEQNNLQNVKQENNINVVKNEPNLMSEKDDENKKDIRANLQETKLGLTKLAQNNVQNIHSEEAQTAIANFATQIKDIIKNYSPPITNLKIELNPKDLGTVKLDITKNGNDLQVNIIGNSATLNLFSQNQNTLFQNLQNIGFSQVDLNFSSNQNSDSQNHKNEKEKQNQSGNKNSLESEQDELKIMLYA